jgi:hypothetical protein
MSSSGLPVCGSVQTPLPVHALMRLKPASGDIRCISAAPTQNASDLAEMIAKGTQGVTAVHNKIAVHKVRPRISPESRLGGIKQSLGRQVVAGTVIRLNMETKMKVVSSLLILGVILCGCSNNPPASRATTVVVPPSSGTTTVVVPQESALCRDGTRPPCY